MYWYMQSKFRVTGRGLEFQIRKVGVGECWPRLTVSQKKPAWLKIDFDNLYDSESSSDDSENPEQDFEKEMMAKLGKDITDTKTSAVADVKLGYLFIYNMFQFIGFSLIFVKLQYKYWKDGEDSKGEAFENVGPTFMMCQIVACLEIVHVLTGVVKGALLPTIAQVFGRFLILVLIASEDRISDRYVVWYLFLTWSGIELVRYPFYMLSSIKQEIYLITWLRYTLWIPLYPLGFILEGFVLILAVPFFDQTGKFSITLPNAANFAFHFPMFLIFYMIIFMPGAYMLLSYMYKARRKKLHPERMNNETTPKTKNMKKVL
ncbi:unnamed protein product [Owenia fusiformis]|uniref:Very-long-chain (3R)-3-hydroxyacyl-CoA dehydratase n=1 Tax=Owenia fusiformis TaxID=6347 RepID=A0A8S4PVE9_OWEFU|nr:unnamed protein product [Owenia fusiformis]